MNTQANSQDVPATAPQPAAAKGSLIQTQV